MINDKKVLELLEIWKEYSSVLNYHRLLECIEAEIFDYENEDNYQGDSWYLFKKGNKYGYLVFGWGSCSACDALQACNNFNDLKELLETLVSKIIWKSKEEMLEYFITKDWELEYYGTLPEFNSFKTWVVEYFKNLEL